MKIKEIIILTCQSPNNVQMSKASHFTPVNPFVFILIITLKVHSSADQIKVPEIV